MRRAIFFVLFLSPALARTARGAIPWKASARITEDRLNVFWESCPPGAREWEAFLSLDGGRSFPLRVTPHLSTAVRSFSWPIPWILAEDAKLRIRFGDETSEREFDVDGGWTLVPARDSRPLSPESRDLGQGPAPGEEQTAAWVEWNGSRARTVVPAAPPGARSSSEWRPAGISWLALPSRRLRAARPTSSSQIARRPLDLPAPPVAGPLQPSPAASSRLNL